MFADTDFLRNDEIYLSLDRLAEGDPVKGWVPAYHFVICLLDGTPVGKCDLRIGHNEKLYYGDNIGYRVEEPFRGTYYRDNPGAYYYVEPDTLELLMPGRAAIPLQLQTMRNAEGEEISCAPHPHMQVFAKLPEQVPEMSLIRRKN